MRTERLQALADGIFAIALTLLVLSPLTLSGGRLDEIMRAVRACPSGALGYGIEVTRNGPYGVAIPVGEGNRAGDPVKPAAGASRAGDTAI